MNAITVTPHTVSTQMLNNTTVYQARTGGLARHAVDNTQFTQFGLQVDGWLLCGAEMERKSITI